MASNSEEPGLLWVVWVIICFYGLSDDLTDVGMIGFTWKYRGNSGAAFHFIRSKASASLAMAILALAASQEVTRSHM